MREVLWFIASLAGAAILAALTVILSPQSPFWRAILHGGIWILMTCAVLIFLDMRQPLKERARVIPLIGMVICGLGFLGLATWYFWPSQSEIATNPPVPDSKPAAIDQLTIPLLWRTDFNVGSYKMLQTFGTTLYTADGNKLGTFDFGVGFFHCSLAYSFLVVITRMML